MPIFTPLTDGLPGVAETFNSRLREMETAILANPGTLIARVPWTTLTANQTEIVINVTPGDNTLELMATLRTDSAVGQIDSAVLTLNDDMASTYYVRYFYFDSTAVATEFNNSSTEGFTLGAAATVASSTAGRYGFLTFRIPLASTASAKPCAYDSIVDASNPAFSAGGAYYPGAAPITKLKLTPGTGTNFAAGCRYALFGMA